MAFEDEYEFELLTQPDDAKIMAKDIALSLANSNETFGELNITYDDYYHYMLDELLTAGIKDQLTVFCRHKATGVIVSGSLNVRRENTFDCRPSTNMGDFLDFCEFEKRKLDFVDVESNINMPVVLGDAFYVRDSHLGRGIGKKMAIMKFCMLRESGMGGLFVQIISEVSQRILEDITTEEFARKETKFSEYVTSDGRKPYAHVPGTLVGVIATTQLKPQYLEWAHKQTLLRAWPQSINGAGSAGGSTRRYSTLRQASGVSTNITTAVRKGMSMVKAIISRC